jgi:hypothetical protein
MIFALSYFSEVSDCGSIVKCEFSILELALLPPSKVKFHGDLACSMKEQALVTGFSEICFKLSLDSIDRENKLLCLGRHSYQLPQSFEAIDGSLVSARRYCKICLPEQTNEFMTSAEVTQYFVPDIQTGEFVPTSDRSLVLRWKLVQPVFSKPLVLIDLRL